MATTGIVDNMLNGIQDVELQLILKSVFKYVLRDIRFGRATPATGANFTPSTNGGGGFFTATTPATANMEFAVQHAFGHAPYLMWQVMPLDQVNAAIVRLTLSRAADSTYVYLKSPETSQPIYLYIEG